MTDQAAPAMPKGVAILRFGVPTIALISAIAWGLLSYREAAEAARQHTQQAAALVTQYTERLLQTQTILQRAALERARSEPPEFLRSQAFHRFLQQVTRTQGFIEGLVVIGFDGQIIASSGSYPVDRNMGVREYISAIAQGSTLFIDRITIEPNDVDAVVIATPFETEGFRGLIASAIGVNVMREFLLGAASGTEERAAIVRDDGKVLVRNLNTEAAPLPATSILRDAMAQAPSGNFVATSPSDGVERAYSYQRIVDYPLFASFGTPSSATALRWLARTLPVWTVLAAISVFTFLTSGRIQRSISSRFEADLTRQRLEEAERLAEQRRRLMAEMNHRVKNNLAMVAALISLQLRNKGEVDGVELKARVMAISEVHEFLYQTPDSQWMDFSEIIRRICSSPAIIPQERGIRVKLEIEPGISVDPDHATALALCAAEVLTNAVKHAFAGREDGTITVTLTRSGDEGIMEIADNGVGLPQQPARSSGLRIIDGLVAQVGGSIERNVADGTRIRIRFPLRVAS